MRSKHAESAAKTNRLTIPSPWDDVESEGRMNRVLESGSIGKLAGLAARIVGWSPVGRQIELRSVEGPASTMIVDRRFEVHAVTGECLIVVARNVL